jgi:DNA-binding transcriptional regulator YdaS (Cro superfamily)
MRRFVVACCGALAFAGTASGANSVVRTTAPGVVRFGDTFTYVVEVRAPADARIAAPTAPFTPVDEPQLETSGGALRLTQRLACLSEACIGQGASRRVRLAAARVTAAGSATVGRSRSIVVRGRVTPAEVAAGLSAFHRNTALPPRGDAGTATSVLALVAALLAVVALILAVYLLRPRRHSGVDALERALRLLRQSATREPPDRRRAADLLARVARDRDAERVSADATNVAWSRRDPATADAEELATRAARELA